MAAGGVFTAAGIGQGAAVRVATCLQQVTSAELSSRGTSEEAWAQGPWSRALSSDWETKPKLEKMPWQQLRSYNLQHIVLEEIQPEERAAKG